MLIGLPAVLPIYSPAGEVSEWLKVPLSKSGEVNSLRGFESHPLRQFRIQTWHHGSQQS